MAAKLDVQMLGLVFESRPDLLSGIKKAADTPARTTLFNDIAKFMHHRLASVVDQDGHAAKRRRVDITQGPALALSSEHAQRRGEPPSLQNVVLSAAEAVAEPVLLEVKDISATAPQRKKFELCFTKTFLYARASGTSFPVQGIVYPWKDVEHMFYLPVPDKAQAQHSFVLLPRQSYLPTAKQAGSSAGGEIQPLEPLVFTVPATPPKPGSVGGQLAKTAESVSDTYSSLFHWALTTSMRSAGNHSCQLVASDPKLFHSMARQAYRPNEKSVHVKAFRGSKDGFLFFLPTGILWGFKKPLVFLPLDRIVAISYTNILRTTFNIVVELDTESDTNALVIEKEIEFAMIDQEDYHAIDQTYIRRHGLADSSMAEQRKAKRELAENTRKATAADETNGEDGQTGDMTQLERAQHEAEQQLQDEEDELEEDYDPGSESDSEGEDASSDDDDEDQGDSDEDEDKSGGMDED